jgi:predicted ester cyclase
VVVRSSEDFTQFDRASRESFPDQPIVVEKLIAEGDCVAAWCRYVGTQKGPMGPFPASGKQVDVDFAGYFRVAAGRLAELWVTWDNVSMLGQLGHFPPAS